MNNEQLREECEQEMVLLSQTVPGTKSWRLMVTVLAEQDGRVRRPIVAMPELSDDPEQRAIMMRFMGRMVAEKAHEEGWEVVGFVMSGEAYLTAFDHGMVTKLQQDVVFLLAQGLDPLVTFHGHAVVTYDDLGFIQLGEWTSDFRDEGESGGLLDTSFREGLLSI